MTTPIEHRQMAYRRDAEEIADFMLDTDGIPSLWEIGIPEEAIEAIVTRHRLRNDSVQEAANSLYKAFKDRGQFVS